jgi:hypothetical protein
MTGLTTEVHEPPTSPSTRSGLSTGLGPILLRDLPYFAMLVLGIGGVAYRSFSGGPILLYWQILLPLFGVMCVLAGWPAARTFEQRRALIWTQALHWAAFMLVTYVLSLKQLRGVLNDNAMALALLALLALSTFVAGVHARAWRICVIGVVMGLALPAVAWVDQAAILLLLCTVALLAVVFVFWFAGRRTVSTSG